MKAEQRLVMEKVVHGRDVFAQFNTDGIREELDISDLAPSVQMSQIYGPQFSFKPLTCDRFSALTSHGRPGEVTEAAEIGESNCKDRNITVKTLIQEHPFSEFRLIGFLYIGYFR